MRLEKAVINYSNIPKDLLALYREVSKHVETVHFYSDSITLKASLSGKDKRTLVILWFTLFCMSIDGIDKELLSMFFGQFDIIKKDIFNKSI